MLLRQLNTQNFNFLSFITKERLWLGIYRLFIIYLLSYLQDHFKYDNWSLV